MTPLLVLALLTMASSSYQDPIPQSEEESRYLHRIAPGVNHITSDPGWSSFHLHVQSSNDGTSDLGLMQRLCRPAMLYWYDQYKQSDLTGQTRRQLFQEYNNVLDMIKTKYEDEYNNVNVVHLSKNENGAEVVKTTAETIRHRAWTKGLLQRRINERTPSIVICRDQQ